MQPQQLKRVLLDQNISAPTPLPSLIKSDNPKPARTYNLINHTEVEEYVASRQSAPLLLQDKALR